ncbi:hypothetical protein [Kocuria kalidii]|uniref:hypothetical protein n=1 Tax=Kocuria kalidii TaxID=3376283 RepID=UPI003790A625
MSSGDSEKRVIGDPPNYSTLMRVATVAAIIGAIGLGFTSAFSGAPEWLALTMMAFYFVGFLPSYMYLGALVKENKRKGV